LFDIAPKFNTLLIFGEHRFVLSMFSGNLAYLGSLFRHRYYGKSLPFGNKSFDLDKVGWLTSEQTLADYSVLLTALKVYIFMLFSLLHFVSDILVSNSRR
jgi:hypothetical protein